MTVLFAGVGKSRIVSHDGVQLAGYANRDSLSREVHDHLEARALVLSDGIVHVVLCSVELCWLRTREVLEIRQSVASRCNLPAENIFICTTHTHSGPNAHDAEAWEGPLATMIADAVLAAYHAQQPAKMGSGCGQLWGYSINRRWLNRPVDPSVGIIRVDTADGLPLALLGNFACHAVVLGHDNDRISGDWPGISSRLLETESGIPVVLFTQGGAGDVNPLTEGVRQRLKCGHPVRAIWGLSTCYAADGIQTPDIWDISDRCGGTFVEAETLARAYNAEAMRIWRAIRPVANVSLRVERVIVDGRGEEDEPPPQGLPPAFSSLLPDVDISKMEIMVVKTGDALLIGIPGEVFSEDAVEIRKTCQQLGYLHPMVLGYANGSFAYLPPEGAFVEGGYEVRWARGLGLSRKIQKRIRDAVLPVLQKINHKKE